MPLVDEGLPSTTEWIHYGLGSHEPEHFKIGDHVYVWAKGKLSLGTVRAPNPSRPRLIMSGRKYATPRRDKSSVVSSYVTLHERR